MSRFRRITVATAVSGAALLAGAALLYGAGIRVNTTPSIPQGVYRISDAPIERGAYVIFCPPNAAVFDEARKRGYIGAGFCPGGVGQMMKKVLAAKGDRITVRDDGVRINGDIVPLSVPLNADGAGRPLPRYHPTGEPLPPAEFLLMSDVTDKSFDSRYFGPIHATQIRGVLRPLFTW